MKNVLLLFFIFVSSSGALFSESRLWRMEHTNEEFEAELFGRHGALVYFGNSKSYFHCAFIQLSSADREWIVEHEESKGSQPAVEWQNSESKIAKAIRGKLYQKEGDKLEKLELGDRSEPEFYVFYYGASWCGPCRRFVPILKSWYNQFKDHGVENFELIFVSSDRTGESQKDYVKKSNMPWPFLKWRSSYGRTIENYSRRSIPGLVIVNRNGRILHDAHSGNEYRGAYTVLDELKRLLYSTNPKNPISLRENFQHLKKQYVDGMRNASSNPQIVYDYIPDAFRKKMNGRSFSVLMDIRGDGRVFNVELEDPEGSVEEEELISYVFNWLFFPKIENGYVKDTKVKLPLSFSIEA